MSIDEIRPDNIILRMIKFDRSDISSYQVMTRQQVRDYDSRAINVIGIPGVVLMENAGLGCVRIIRDEIRPSGPVRILCGIGNNGGDGYVIARHLFNLGMDVKVMICGDRSRIAGDALINLNVIEKLKIPVEILNPAKADDMEDVPGLLGSCSLVIDALFGTGLSDKLRKGYDKIVEIINSSGKTVLAVDIPSGLDCDTGMPLGTSVKADYTATFVAVKNGFVQNSASQEYTGQVYIVSIGV